MNGVYMEEFEKRIEINENRILIYKIIPDSFKPTYIITEGFFKDGEVEKTYTLSQGDDYGFGGWQSSDSPNRLSFEFDIDHPLYLPLFHLLNYDGNLLIDDDETIDDFKKYMSIKRVDKKIIIEFIDVKKYADYTKKFQVLIKNVLFDGRSKIDQSYSNTKHRLAAFFNEVYDELTNDYHQMNIEEELIRTSSDEEIDEYKKVFKKTRL